MTEEIKEIFYKLKSDDYYEKHYQQSVYYEKDLNKLENYITNLQKENQSLKEKLNCKEYFSSTMPENTEFVILTKENYDRQQKDLALENIILKSRNEKAIECIKSKKAIINTDYIRIFDLFEIEEQGYTNDLLNILQGGDE